MWSARDFRAEAVQYKNYVFIFSSANATGLQIYAELTKLKQKESLFRRGLSEGKRCVKIDAGLIPGCTEYTPMLCS